MAVISVDIPDKMLKKIKPFTVIKMETLLSVYFNETDSIEFDFRKEKINQDEFLSYLKWKHG